MLEKLSLFSLNGLWSNGHWSYLCENGLVCSRGTFVFKMMRLSFSCKLDWSSYMIAIAKTATKKIGTLIRTK